jgi:hypothetical protein
MGLVVEPDAETIRAAYDLAATLLPADAEQRLGPGSLPHVTLTQCAVSQLPVARVAAFADRLTQRLAGRCLALGPVTAFGGGFLFWCIEADAPERPVLQHAHEDAITLGQGFLDPAANGARGRGHPPADRRRRHARGQRPRVQLCLRQGQIPTPHHAGLRSEGHSYGRVERVLHV